MQVKSRSLNSRCFTNYELITPQYTSAMVRNDREEERPSEIFFCFAGIRNRLGDRPSLIINIIFFGIEGFRQDCNLIVDVVLDGEKRPLNR